MNDGTQTGSCDRMEHHLPISYALEKWTEFRGVIAAYATFVEIN